jgi:hypothetical protein
VNDGEVWGDIRIVHGNGGSRTRFCNATIGGQSKIKIGAGDGLVLVENSTFDRKFKADGCRGTDTFIDGGGNTFSSGSPKLKKFEIVLP